MHACLGKFFAIGCNGGFMRQSAPRAWRHVGPPSHLRDMRKPPVPLKGAPSLREDTKPCTSPATPQHPYPPASRGREWNFTIPLPPRAGRTRVQSREPLANVQLPYPPASRGREWNFTIPLLRVRGRTRVRSREPPATPHLPYPPASRGREWNFPIPLSPRAGTHAGTSSENNWYVADAGPPRSGGPPACCAAAYAPPNRAHGCPDRGRRVGGLRRARRRTDDCLCLKTAFHPRRKKRKDAAEAAPFAGAVLSRRIRRGPSTS